MSDVYVVIVGRDECQKIVAVYTDQSLAERTVQQIDALPIDDRGAMAASAHIEKLPLNVFDQMALEWPFFPSKQE